jgi:hypothetical protein
MPHVMKTATLTLHSCQLPRSDMPVCLFARVGWFGGGA